jgi:hypothetical protein
VAGQQRDINAGFGQGSVDAVGIHLAGNQAKLGVPAKPGEKKLPTHVVGIGNKNRDRVGVRGAERLHIPPESIFFVLLRECDEMLICAVTQRGGCAESVVEKSALRRQPNLFQIGTDSILR